MKKLTATSIVGKIAENAYQVKEIAQNLCYGADTPHKYGHFFELACKERYFKKGKQYIHNALVSNCLGDYKAHVLILPEKADFLTRELADANIAPLPYSYMGLAQSYAKPKLIFPVHRFFLKCAFDTEKHFVLDDSIVLHFEPATPINYCFASLYFQSHLARFLHQSTRKSMQSISVEDIGNLCFPKLSLSVQDSLLPVIDRLAFMYRVFEAEKLSFWQAFDVYFFQTNIEISPLQDTFFEYNRPLFWQKIDELRKIGGIKDYKADRKKAKYLEKDFDSSQFRLKAMQAQIQQTEKIFNQVLYQHYNLTEEEIKLVENG